MYWRNVAQAKIVCAVKSEEELLELANKARSLNLPFCHLPGEGLGIFGNLTVVNEVTGSLKLY